MKYAYPIILTPAGGGAYVVTVPDFDINTQGKDLADALYMARDAISLVGIDLQDDNKAVPPPSPLESVVCEVGEHVAAVDVDFDAYRKTIETRAVKKTLTVPSNLNAAAERAGLNFSKILQEGLRQHLGMPS